MTTVLVQQEVAHVFCFEGNQCHAMYILKLSILDFSRSTEGLRCDAEAIRFCTGFVAYSALHTVTLCVMLLLGQRIDTNL